MSKELDALPALSALAGIALHVSQDDRGQDICIASRWTMTCWFSSLVEVEVLLSRVTGETLTDTGA